MFSKLGGKFRSFLSKDQEDSHRRGTKRQLESEEDSDDVISTPAKRGRHLDEENILQHSQSVTFSTFAEWLVRKKNSFTDSYYFKVVTDTASPRNLMQKLKSFTGSRTTDEDIMNNSQNLQPASRVRSDSASSANINRHPRPGPSSSAHMAPPPGMFSRNDIFQMPMHPPGMAHMPPPPGYGSRGMGYGGIPRYNGTGRPGLPTYRSMYDKTYMHASRTIPPMGRGRAQNKSRLAAKEIIREDEKRRYAELLQHYTNVPLSHTLDSQSFRTGTPIFSSSQRTDDSTILGTDTSVNDMPVKETSPSDTAVKIDVQPSKSLSCKARADLSSRSFSFLRASRVSKSPELSTAERTPLQPKLTNGDALHSDSSVIILDENSSDTSCKTPSQKASRTPSVEMIEKAIKESPYASSDWLESLKERFSADKRRKEREITETEIKRKFYTERREEWEEALEKKIQQRLRLSTKEPAVLEEDFVESEEEQEEYDEFPELTEDMENAVDAALVPYPPGQVLSEGFKLQITRKDMETLNGLNWLNDEIINFYMEMLKERGTQEGCAKVHAFNTFFYPKIMSGGHSSVQRWTKRFDIFTFDFILIPVHLGMHWCLAAVNFKKKTISYYDSMMGNNMKCLKAIEQYLKDEHVKKKNQPYDMSEWQLILEKDIPQQMNGSDCGVFTCKYAEYVTREVPITFTQKHMPYFRRRMVHEILTKTLM